MEYFLSCDWGTTSFRLRMAGAKDGAVFAEEKSNQGIASTFNSWLETGGTDDETRIAFYLDIIGGHIKKLEQHINHSLTGVPLIISGMASSSIGITEIPYSTLPFAINGAGINSASVSASKGFSHDVLIISGARTVNDVMRGEETQLIGCTELQACPVKNALYIFPGTHSKHITVKDNQAVDVKTYMTGEFFELLSQKSILKNDVSPGEMIEPDLSAFKSGVHDAVPGNLLNAIFKVRTNNLFKLYTKDENLNYLSGLLIGMELKDLYSTAMDSINLVCSSELGILYHTALHELNLKQNINNFLPQWADKAVVIGQLKIGRELNFLL